MSINWDAIIDAAIKEGFAIKDIASQVTEALNKSQKKADAPTRESVIKNISDAFEKHMKDDKLDLADASALIWLCAVEDTDVGKTMTSPEELIEFFDFIGDDIKHIVDRWKACDSFTKAYHDALRHKKCECQCHNKSNEVKKAEPDRKPKTDGDIILAFLKENGLLK